MLMTLLNSSRLLSASTSSTLRSPACAAARALTRPPATWPATNFPQITSTATLKGVFVPSAQFCKRAAGINSALAAPHGIGRISRSRNSSSASSPQQAQHSSSAAVDTLPPGSTRAKRAMPPVRDTVVLNELEQELCAGGWVRDKLLGRDSLDIDIALDSMLGKDFAELVNQHLSSQGKEVRTAAVIQSNPEQSKHLETARLKISGLWIDLVNLRSETYARGSRIPQMEFGTPEQDALRRDFTINSLFYNINKGMVEDFTGRGIADLREGIIRTPLPPTETFLDDPLRVLRAVRFAARFACDLEQSVEDAAANKQVGLHLDLQGEERISCLLAV
ncbi:hypothetical protein DUNSADRAFT_15846 [Dunaliella salina]|uniref:Poly A polymerase head domain-containing protein n=1 Tax=Dunaliella salina TaxID=3046 RepID=A0ABQ7G4T5_DUNSA|nr:hypothetical protein DUNSADRAFT_15846 [Dunaliella salina]|eukprot:KAF5829607.1 hypothetical protein DUNSADRAFT_15846 [Dunaliella salina]